MKSIEEYNNRLESFEFSPRTKTEYLRYYKDIFIMLGKDIELDNDLATYFFKKHPNSMCRAMLNDYAKWQDIKIDLDKRILRKKKKEKTYISPDEIKMLARYLGTIKEKQYKYMLMICYYGALRTQELLGLSYKQLVADHKEWDRTGRGALRLTIKASTSKGHKGRVVLIPPKVAKSFFKFLNKNEAFILQHKHKTEIWKVTQSQWDKAFRKACVIVLGRPYGLHELRFSRATYWHRVKGLDIIEIKTLLGHSSVKTTEIYIKPDTERILSKLEKSYGK